MPMHSEKKEMNALKKELANLAVRWGVPLAVTSKNVDVVSIARLVAHASVAGRRPRD